MWLAHPDSGECTRWPARCLAEMLPLLLLLTARHQHCHACLVHHKLRDTVSLAVPMVQSTCSSCEFYMIPCYCGLQNRTDRQALEAAK